MKRKIKSIIILNIVTVLLMSCRHDQGCHRRVRGNGNYVDQNHAFDFINKVEVDGSINLHFSVSEHTEVKVRAESNIIDNIEVMVSSGLLTVKPEKGVCLNHKNLDVYISVPSIQELKLDGSTKVDGEIITDRLLIHNNGSSKVDLSGNANSLSVVNNGDSSFDLYKMIVQNAKFVINGSGDANVNVSETLNIDINGSGNIKYRGNPSVNQKINGSGKVVNDN